jgi:tRNA threonylcarbamoyladenosine biosynthesis protein TsaE
MFEMVSQSETDTLDAGEEFAGSLEPGDIVMLFGDLGAGKTKLVQGICSKLGVNEPVVSPTFTLINTYTGKKNGDTLPLFHIDCYRLSDTDEAVHAGVEDCFREDAIAFIEWPEICLPLVNGPYWHVEMIRGHTENIRHLRIFKTERYDGHTRN